MGFLSPITALIAAAVAVPILVSLYFLKLRRRELAVPSTLLWRRAVQDLQVNAPFQKLRKNLLLLLQLLLLAALLLAMARPTIRATAQPGQRVAILIDHSASMNADDVAPTRLDEAKRAALELIDNLDAGGSGEAMTVSFADRARVVQPATRDLTLLRAAVRSIPPTDQPTRLGAALRMIQATADEKMVVYVISDGRADLPEGETLSLRGAQLRYVRVGEPRADNVGIVSFSARRDFERPEIVQVFARLANFGPAAVDANLQLRLDGALNRVQGVSLPPATEAGPGAQSVQFDFVLPGSALVTVAHDHDDALAADDVANLTLAPARRLRVLLVGQSNAFLERVIRSVGVRQLVLMTPEKYAAQDPEQLRRGGWDDAGLTTSTEAGFDVIVFDGYAPERVPVVPSLYFAAAPPVEGLAVKPPREGAPEAQVILDWQRDHPLMRYVVLDDVVLQSPGRLTVPGDAQVLATGQTGPILAELRREGVRHVVASFDVLQTNWPLYVSFPVFVSNVVQTLGLGGLAEEAGLSYRTGEVAVIPLRDRAGTLSYEGPIDLEARVGEGQAVLPSFEAVGVYQASRASIDPPYDQLAVNLLSETESDLRPVDQLEVGTTVASGQTRSASIRREVWPWFVWGALALLMVEWLVYTRRMHI